MPERCLDDPSLRDGIGNLIGYQVEPGVRLRYVANATPELTNQIDQNSTIVPRDGIIKFQRLLERPRRKSPEIPLGLDITFVHTAPGSTKPEISDVSRIGALPFSYLCCSFIFFRTGGGTVHVWR